MENILDSFKGFNIHTIISVFLMLWYFSNHIENKIQQQCQRTDRLYEMFVSLQKEMKDEMMIMQKDTKDMFIDLLKEKK